MYLPVQNKAAPGKKKKKKGKKQAKGGQQDQLAGQVAAPDNAALAHKVACSRSKADFCEQVCFQNGSAPLTAQDVCEELVMVIIACIAFLACTCCLIASYQAFLCAIAISNLAGLG